MESNFNLESISELSEMQLEALIRYDSPPETPVQPTDPTALHEDLNERKNANAISDNCNNDQDFVVLASQAYEKMDFSIFDPYSTNIQYSIFPLNENDNYMSTTSQLDTVKISDITSKKSNLECDIFTEIHQKENTNNSPEGKEFSVNETNLFTRGEIDIYRKIEYMPHLEANHMNRQVSSNSINRKCQTQLELKSDLNNSHEKIRYSCPADLACTSVHSKLLYKKNSGFSRENLFEGTIDRGKFNSINLTDITESEDKNECNINTQLCLSQDKTHNESCSIFGSFGCSQRQSQVEIQTSARHLVNETFSNDKFQQCTTVKNSTDLCMIPNASSIPLSIKQLYDIVKANYSDFAFIYALSSQLCQDRVPMECFVTLKMALLLSLASIGNNEYRAPIPIVAITNDTYMTDYLMSNIGQLASRFLGPVDEEKSPLNNNWIEADSILLARGGVYYAGDWTRIKIRRAEAIFKNIECSNVAVEKSTLNFPLETSIWTHWRSYKHSAKDQQTFNKFLKIFGIPIFVSDDNHDSLIDYTLEQSSIRNFESTVDHLSVNEDDMRSFLVYVSQNNVDLSPEAAFLLKNYFVASRSVRQDCLSKQSYIILKQFAESFAKLSMRKVVSSEDAVAAIIMSEHFIENVFSVGSNSPPHFGNFSFVGEVDKYLMQFRKWLDSYIENFTNQ